MNKRSIKAFQIFKSSIAQMKIPGREQLCLISRINEGVKQIVSPSTSSKLTSPQRQTLFLSQHFTLSWF